MKTLFILLCVFISFHCQSNEIGKTIDMAHPQRKEITCEQTYISLADSLDFHFIPLETNDSCLIGSIAAVQIVDDRIFLLEGQKREALFVFDMNGKFKQQIGKKGGGPEEYQYISSFDIDTERRLIALADPVRERILFYDLDTYQFKQALHPKFYYNQFRLLPNRNVLFFFANGFENAEDLNDNASYYVLMTDSLLKPKRTYYKADFTTPYTSRGLGQNNLYRIQNETYVYHHLFPELWKFENGQLNPAYHVTIENFDFPTVSFLKGESDIADKKRDYTAKLKDSNFISSYRIDECESIISFSILQGNMPVQAIYHKQSGKGYVFSLKDYFQSMNLGMLMFPRSATDEYIIGSIAMNEDMEKVKENMLLYPFLKGRTLEDNPILCLYKWKK